MNSDTNGAAVATLPPATPAATTAPEGDNPDAQAESRLRNAGDTVRASWNFSLDNVRANIKHLAAEARELLVWALTWCTDSMHEVRFEDFCQRVGYDRNTMWKIYSGLYRHPDWTKDNPKMMDASPKLISALKAFRKIEVQRALMGRPAFFVTPTAKRFFSACDLARESQTPVFVFGGSQIGKTEAARQYCIENNHGRTVLVELEAVNGLKGLLMAVAEKLGISPHANTPDLIHRIKKAVTSDMVIILDEVHLLANVYRKSSFFACMETVRRIFVDHCKCGLVLTFTLLGYSTAEKDRKRELEQIFRRGVHRVNLGDRPTVADVSIVAEGWALELPTSELTVTLKLGSSELKENVRERLGQLSKEDGLKAIVERFRYATKLAAGGKVEWSHFVHADALIRKNATTPVHGWGSN